jgi:hypothetical protein
MKGSKMQKKEKTEKIKTYNTMPKVKAEFWPKFAKLIEQQFQHGGYEKYKLAGFDDREATDVISAVFGGEREDQWILGTILKYLFRWNNLHREKDILKMTTYLYLLWLKQGFHKQSEHDTDTKK